MNEASGAQLGWQRMPSGTPHILSIGSWTPVPKTAKRRQSRASSKNPNMTKLTEWRSGNTKDTTSKSAWYNLKNRSTTDEPEPEVVHRTEPPLSNNGQRQKTLSGTVDLDLGHKPYPISVASVPIWDSGIRLQGPFEASPLDPGRPCPRTPREYGAEPPAKNPNMMNLK